MKIKAILNSIDQIAPFRLAEDWDNTGLQIGDPEKDVDRILFCLEVTREIVVEATRKKAGLIIAHHPLIFKPLSSVRESNYQEWLIAEMIRNNLALIVAHTNLDKAPKGVNSALADLIGLEKRRLLIPSAPEKKYKYVVFVPVGHEEIIIKAINEGGGGIIGDYDHCTFRLSGTGTFRGNENTNPAIGKLGEITQVEECRIEAVVPQRNLLSVHREVDKVHPYEEVAYDLFPLEQLNEELGLGIIGMLDKSMSLKRFITRIKQVFGISTLQFIGQDDDFSVRTIACMGGSANSIIVQLKDRKFDILVTGELSHHNAQLAKDLGLNVICVGHFASERPVSSYFSRILAREEVFERSNVELIVAESEVDPISYS